MVVVFKHFEWRREYEAWYEGGVSMRDLFFQGWVFQEQGKTEQWIILEFYLGRRVGIVQQAVLLNKASFMPQAACLLTDQLKTVPTYNERLPGQNAGSLLQYRD